MSTKIDELRKVRYEHRKVAYTIGELNKRLELEPNRNDIKSMRSQLLRELQGLDLRRSKLTSEIKASPYALADVVEVIDSLANIQSQIAHGGAEEGQLAISALIRYLMHDKDRLTELESGEQIEVQEEPATRYHSIEDWKKIAGTRQGLINKLDKKVRALEAQVEALRTSEPKEYAA